MEGSTFRTYVDCDDKKEILLELGWMVNKGWTNCPQRIYDELNEDSLDEYFLEQAERVCDQIKQDLAAGDDSAIFEMLELLIKSDSKNKEIMLLYLER